MTAGEAQRSPAESFRRVPTGIAIAAGLLMLLGLALRIRGAQNDLWLDEIWSLKLVALLRQGQFLLESLALDNNHYLNTLYLFVLGPDADPLALRAFSILLGIAAIPVAAIAMRRAGAAGVIAGMALFAGGYFFVNYGSEARGYAGLILMTLLAIVLVENGVESYTRSTANRLAIVAGIGFLFQPVMVVSLGIVGLWALWLYWRSTRDTGATLIATLRLFMPALTVLLPIAILVGGAVLRSGEYLMAARTPFSFAHLVEGYAGLYRTLLGIPDAVPGLAVLIVPAVILLLALRLLPQRRVSLGIIAMVIVPLLVLIARPPNVQFPRYYLGSGIVFLLLLAGIFAEAWRGAAKGRVLAAIVAVAVICGNGTEIAKLYRFGRGDPLPALRQAAEAGGPLLASQPDSIVVDYLAPRHGLPITTLRATELCSGRPRFMLTSSGDTPEQTTYTGPGCAITYREVMQTPFWGLSGAPWTLYRAIE